MDKKTLLMLALSGILIVLLSGAAYYKAQLSQQESILARAMPNNRCDLHQETCEIELPEGRKVSLSIQPRPIPLVTPLDIQVSVEGESDINSVLVDFQGTTMNMGPNRVKLVSDENGSFTGNGMLPVCIRNSMEWQAEVMVRTGNGTYVAPFIFVTRK